MKLHAAGTIALAFIFLCFLSALSFSAPAADNNAICTQLFGESYSYMNYSPATANNESGEFCCVQLGGGDWQCSQFPGDMRSFAKDVLLQVITASEPSFPDSFSINVSTSEGFVRTTNAKELSESLYDAAEYPAGSGNTIIYLLRDTSPRLVKISVLQSLVPEAPAKNEPDVSVKFTGEALVLVNNDWSELEANSTFYGNETFRTGAGLLGIYYPDGSFFALNENTLADFSGTEERKIGIALAEGEIYCAPNSALASVRIFMKKPGLSVSSEGGKFSARKSGSQAEILVYSGSADAFDDANEAGIQLIEGEKLAVSEGELPGIAERLDSYRKWWLPVSNEKAGCCAGLIIPMLALAFMFMSKR